MGTAAVVSTVAPAPTSIGVARGFLEEAIRLPPSSEQEIGLPPGLEAEIRSRGPQTQRPESAAAPPELKQPPPCKAPPPEVAVEDPQWPPLPPWPRYKEPPTFKAKSRPPERPPEWTIWNPVQDVINRFFHTDDRSPEVVHPKPPPPLPPGLSPAETHGQEQQVQSQANRVASEDANSPSMGPAQAEPRRPASQDCPERGEENEVNQERPGRGEDALGAIETHSQHQQPPPQCTAKHMISAATGEGEMQAKKYADNGMNGVLSSLAPDGPLQLQDGAQAIRVDGGDASCSSMGPAPAEPKLPPSGDGTLQGAKEEDEKQRDCGGVEEAPGFFSSQYSAAAREGQDKYDAGTHMRNMLSSLALEKPDGPLQIRGDGEDCSSMGPLPAVASAPLEGEEEKHYGVPKWVKASWAQDGRIVDRPAARNAADGQGQATEGADRERIPHDETNGGLQDHEVQAPCGDTPMHGRGILSSCQWGPKEWEERRAKELK